MGSTAALHQAHLELPRSQDVPVDLPYLLQEHLLGLSDAEIGEAEGEAGSAGDAEVAAEIGEEAGPILRCLEVQLLHVEYKLANLLRTEDALQQGRRLALVLVRHPVAEERPHG